MAVYTDVSDEALTQFLTEYDLGEPVSFAGIAEGVENSNFLLRTTKGSFILTLYERRVAKSDLPFFLGLMDHLAAQGFSCPVPVHGRDGNALRELQGRPAALVTFLDGVSVRKPGVKHCAEVGRALAALHAAGKDFNLTRANALSVGGWRPLLDACGTKADQISAGLYQDLDQALAGLEQAWPQGLPQGVIHADLFPDNVFFLSDRLTGVIDFYFSCNDALAYDIAVCLNAWCFEPDGGFNLTKGQAMLSAYRAMRPLTKAEVAALPILARGAAIRFLLTRLYDFLNQVPGALVKPKDPREYLTKLRFHLSARTAADYGW